MLKNKQFITTIIGLFLVFGLVQGFVLAAAKVAVKQQVDQIIANELKLKELKVDRLVIGGEPRLGAGFNLNDCSTATATTSLVYLAQSATTTLTCKIEGADLIDLNLLVAATTTSRLSIGIEKLFSFNGIDYYGEAQRTAVSGNLTRTVAASTTIDVLQLTNTGTSTTNLSVEPIAEKYMKVNVGVGNGATGVFIQVVRRSLINR